MDWKRKEIIKKAVSLILSVLLTILAIVMIIGIATNDDNSGAGLFIFVIMLVLFALATWSSFVGLKEAIEDYNQTANSNIFEELRYLNTYNSQANMNEAFNEERQNAIFEDNDFVITKSFFFCSTKDHLFIIDGILDVKLILHKVNGIIDYVSLSILYYDGKKYEFKFNRSLGISNMQEKVDKVELVANLVARYSDNFRKYSTCRL